MNKLITILFVLLYLNSDAQVESKSSIVLTNNVDSLRQVKGLGMPLTDSNGLSTKTFVSGYFYYGNANSSLIQLDFIPDYTTINPGMYFNINFQQANYSNLMLQIDQLPPVSILNYDNSIIDSGYISAGEIISVVYNGSNFILVNPPKDKCPGGFAKVNERFCIEIDERQNSNFFVANNTCMDLGYELCRYGDWFQACYNTPGLNNMTNNYEWINNAGNSADQIKVMGMDSNSLTGCDKTYTRSITVNAFYRCCYYLKK